MKCPVAYFLINKIGATIRAQLATALIYFVLFDAGIVALSLTSHETSTNIRTYEHLGCVPNIDNPNLSFPYPSDGSVRVHCLLDPCHMIKLCRNAMAETNLASDSGAVSFHYIPKAHKLLIE